MNVIKHYEDYHEDQFDFHAYCIRKVTLRTYCEMLKFEDNIWGLPFYGRAAEAVIEIYLKIMDRPAESAEEEEPDYSKMTAAERKKAKSIARKKKKAQEKSDSNGSSKEETTKCAENGKTKASKNHPVNQDPNGVELLALDPTEEAKKFAAILVRHAPNKISSWALQFDVSVRRGKMLMALQVSDTASLGYVFYSCYPANFDMFRRRPYAKSRTLTQRAINYSHVLSSSPRDWQLLPQKLILPLKKLLLPNFQN